jgi:N-acyl-D-amino-acid deacylase
MSYDIVIKNGTIVDGTGRAGYRADLAISQGKIVEIGKVKDGAAKTIDASDLIVSPGFIDPHTHYDGQICWDPLVTASSWHGVTSVVMGNCGVGLAPCKPEFREIATWDLVNVEAIPFEVLNQGLTWDWESFPQFMDAAERRGSGINLGFLAPLTPFRHYVMGEESMERAATAEETGQIKALIKEAVAAGALGFSTTNAPQHIGYKSRPLACRLADQAELKAYASTLKELGKGTIEIIINRRVDAITPEECDLLDMLLTASGRQITWLVLRKFVHAPQAYQEMLRVADQVIKRGAHPQLATMELIGEFSFRQPSLALALYPSWKPAFNATLEEQTALYSDPAFRAAFREEATRRPGLFTNIWNRVTVNFAKNPAIRALEGKTVEQVARERGRDPLDTFFDLPLEDNLETRYCSAMTEVPTELLTDSRVLIGESDGGAHVADFCTAGYTSDLIGKWVRERQVLSLEQAIKRTTSEPADFFGIRDRGRLTPGFAADIAIFDYNRIACSPRESVDDLPGGGRRFVVRSQGIEYTIVNGQVLYEGGAHSGALPGHVLRS